MRIDQIAAARYWGIGVEPKDEGHSVSIANFILRRAMSRLASDLSCVGRLCHACARDSLQPEAVKWTNQGQGVSFERLIADVLNEDEFRATHAPLCENLFEWTDLRVRYPDLQRKHGARVQVKLIGEQSLHASKLERCKDLASYVVVTPIDLANHVECFLESEMGCSIEAGFWESLGSQPADRDELAIVLWRVFRAAILEPRRHPMGPMVQIPGPIRSLVRSYVKAKSFAASKHVKDLAQGRAGFRPHWLSPFSNR
jgi:hypothetical protein